MVYVGKHAKNLADSLGLKLWVTKHDDKQVLNIYCRKRDRLLCNYDGYNGNYMRGKFKIMSEAAFKTLPFVVMTKKSLIGLIHQVADINREELKQCCL